MSKDEFFSQPHLFPSDYFFLGEKESESEEPMVSEAPMDSHAFENLPIWAVHTKPRAEKKLVTYLEKEGVSHYLPTSLRRHIYGSRQPRTNWVPLFPGYVFLLQKEFVRRTLYRSNAIVQFIEVPDPKQLYDDLKNLWLTLTRKPTEVELASYKPGSLVEVRSGPLKGVVGEIHRTKKKKTRLLIRVHFFDRVVSVDIDAGHVRAL